MKRFSSYVVLALIFFCVISQAALEPSSDPLAEIVAAGVRRSLVLSNSNLNLRMVRNNRLNSFSNLLPTLSASAGRTYSQSQSVNGSSIDSTSARADALSLTGTWNLWNNFQNIRDLQTSAIDVRVQKLTSLADVNNYILNLLSATLDRQLKIQRRESLKDLLAQSLLTKAQSDTLVQVGAKTKFSAMDADIDVLNNQRNTLENDVDLAVSDRTLRVALNTDDGARLPEFDLLTANPYFLSGFEDKLIKFRSAWKAEIETSHPDIVNSKLGLQKSYLALKQTRLDFFPKTSLAINYTWGLDRVVQDPGDGGPRQGLQSGSVMLQFSWQFWDWLQTPRNIQNSEMTYEIATNTYIDTFRKTKSDIQNLFERWDIVTNSIESTNLVLKKAEAQLAYSREMYRLGRITLLEMQQSSTRLFEARTDLASRLSQKYLLAASILVASGENLLPAGVQVPWLPSTNVKSAAE